MKSPIKKAARKSTRAASSRSAPKGAEALAPAEDPFRHVVVLMLENRSFDHMLGALAKHIDGLDGIPSGGSPRMNLGPDGVAYAQAPGAAWEEVSPDPAHEKDNVLYQIRDNNGRFVKDYARAHRDTKPKQWEQVMAYHDTLEPLHTLARSFAVCDAWFSSVPGPTWTNRLFAMSGTSLGRVEMPTFFDPNLHWYDQPSVFRRIEEAGGRCRIHFGDFPLSLLLADRRTWKGAKSFAWLSNFEDEANDDEPSFPDFVWIEPEYMGPEANDDHPPHDVRRGQELIANVYEAIRANDALWRSTLLVIAYDEHGGFYDHALTLPAVPPDGHHEEYDFDRTGVRVPAVLVSPWLEPQVVKTPVDHTALLRSLQIRWGLGNLGERVKQAPDLLGGLRLAGSARTEVPSLRKPAGARAALKKDAVWVAKGPNRLSAHQQAIVAFSAWLDTQTPGAPEAKVAATAEAFRGARASREVAVERAERFLRHRGAQL